MSKKIALLYVGMNQTPISYAEYTQKDIKALSAATEFVIIPGTYLNYLSENHKTELNEVLKEIATLATRIRNWTGKHVWVGVPSVPKPTKTITANEYKGYATSMKNCLGDLKKKINSWMGDSSGFDTYVDGVYMNHEHILVPGDDPDYGVSLSSSNPTAHPQVAMMNTVASYVHNTLGKKMMWIPYYGNGGNWNSTLYSVGVVANKTNIFDYVFLQPNYYMKHNIRDASIDNLYGIRESITLNKVVGRPSAYRVVTGSKTSRTKIGAEMEIDNCHNESDYSNCYARYVDCFDNTGSLTSKSKHSNYRKSNYDFAFYLDAKYNNSSATEFADRLQKVNEFFSN